MDTNAQPLRGPGKGTASPTREPTVTISEPRDLEVSNIFEKESRRRTLFTALGGVFAVLAIISISLFIFTTYRADPTTPKHHHKVNIHPNGQTLLQVFAQSPFVAVRLVVSRYVLPTMLLLLVATCLVFIVTATYFRTDLLSFLGRIEANSVEPVEPYVREEEKWKQMVGGKSALFWGVSVVPAALVVIALISGTIYHVQREKKQFNEKDSGIGLPVAIRHEAIEAICMEFRFIFSTAPLLNPGQYLWDDVNARGEAEIVTLDIKSPKPVKLMFHKDAVMVEYTAVYALTQGTHSRLFLYAVDSSNRFVEPYDKIDKTKGDLTFYVCPMTLGDLVKLYNEGVIGDDFLASLYRYVHEFRKYFVNNIDNFARLMPTWAEDEVRVKREEARVAKEGTPGVLEIRERAKNEMLTEIKRYEDWREKMAAEEAAKIGA